MKQGGSYRLSLGRCAWLASRCMKTKTWRQPAILYSELARVGVLSIYKYTSIQAYLVEPALRALPHVGGGLAGQAGSACIVPLVGDGGQGLRMQAHASGRVASDMAQ